ncbi:hypothetical protein V5O48_014244 [Marasmius crinis-equi]|uniref:Uncharacterized protein n=1 Tax=Marasmius crinis-equi TaxID=585013 RepID=A0ABR3EXX5_9AGAR
MGQTDSETIETHLLPPAPAPPVQGTSTSTQTPKKPKLNKSLNFKKVTASGRVEVSFTNRHTKFARQLKNFSRHKKEMLQLLAAQPGIPQSPDDGWETVIKGKYFDLGKINKDFFFR